MSCTQPATRSPGYLALIYQHTSQLLPHRMRVRLQLGADPYNSGQMSTAADSWSDAASGILNPGFNITGWASYNADGDSVLTGSFGASIPGAHSSPVGTQDYKSATITFTGRGIPGSTGECSGEARNVVFCGATYLFVPGERKFVIATDAALVLYVNFLVANGVKLWGDYYGNRAGARGLATVQYNAATQKRSGT